MAEVITLNDATLEATLNAGKPLMLVFHNSDLRGDFSGAFTKSAAEKGDIIFAKIATADNPQAAERFKIGKKPVLIGWWNGNEVVRRSKPWGTDIPLALDMLVEARKTAPAPVAVTAAEPEMTNTTDTIMNKEQHPVANAPIAVTDTNFQEEVIDYSDNKPVLVDFWAEWCGPCRAVAPVLEKLAGEYGDKIRIAKVDVDANPGLAQYFQIMSIPTIMILKNRTQIFSQPGAFPEDAFRDLIDQAIDLEIPAPEDTTEGEPETES